MAESPDLASSYHRKLKEAYHTEEKLRDPEVVRRSKEHLIRLLDEIEDSLSKTYIAGEEFSMADRLSKTAYIAGEEFSMADVMFIPVLARLALLNLEDEYINSRPNMAKYWSLVQQRPSYKKVIGRYFGGWRKYRTLAKTWCFIRLRNTLKKY
ncbi:glutathione S-transferase TCHQD isoform X1 [Eucalyptus grandis]|nr:glutathione S-transferase TCHQD isoform X1 [Eucalyptus grandis]